MIDLMNVVPVPGPEVGTGLIGMLFGLGTIAVFRKAWRKLPSKQGLMQLGLIRLAADHCFGFTPNCSPPLAECVEAVQDLTVAVELLAKEHGFDKQEFLEEVRFHRKRALQNREVINFEREKR